MREYDICLETVEKVNRFTHLHQSTDDLMGRCPCEADLLSARYIVNAKSLLGVFSLDLSGPLVLRLHGQPDAGLEEALREYGSPRTCSPQQERD